ncbi:MAG: DUF1501 domain-containing protein [Gemmatimonadales bacterium]
MTISRRAFMKAGGLALVSLGADPLFVDRAAYALRQQLGGVPSGKTLVCLFQRGAVDGLSMVVPAGDPWYWRERERIALPKSELVTLDGMFALHPRLASLKPLWDQGAMAVVHAVGSPSTTRSHFDAQDYMESGTPDRKSTASGWANRYCEHAREHAETPFRAVAFGPQLPRMLAGSAPALAIDDLRAFGVRTARSEGNERLTRAFESLYEGAATGLVASSSAEGFEAIKMLKSANPTALPPANGAVYGRGKLATAMQQVAQLIRADLGLRIAFVDVGGWDTHVNQGSGQGQLATRLDELGGALAAFTTDLGERMRDVVVPDDERVRPHREGERHRRHRSRARHGDDGDRRWRARQAGPRPVARPGAGRPPRGTRPRRDHRLPRALRRSAHRAPRRGGLDLGLSGFHSGREARALRLTTSRASL